ncbi:hypothetical protein KKH36_02985 [Patescibacteria group bacterium]|nr:hypothetical protein [Patescibacteria group bacterium]
MKKQKLDLFLIILLPVLAIIIALIFKANFLISTLLFFAPISIYLSYRNKKAIKKTLLSSCVFSIPIFIIVDYIGTINGTWYVPSTIFPFRFLEILPVEDYIWGVALVYLVIMFYEHFFDKNKKESIDKRIKYFYFIFGLGLISFFSILFLKPELFYINYAYFWVGLLFILIPVPLFLFFYPSLFTKFMKTGIYFFFFTLLLELTGVHLGQWQFTSDQYIGWVDLFGNKLPFEEFFFFVMLTAVSILSYYEFFIDDRK